jgi:hypothetical protein
VHVAYSLDTSWVLHTHRTAHTTHTYTHETHITHAYAHNETPLRILGRCRWDEQWVRVWVDVRACAYVCVRLYVCVCHLLHFFYLLLPPHLRFLLFVLLIPPLSRSSSSHVFPLSFIRYTLNTTWIHVEYTVNSHCIQFGYTSNTHWKKT